MRYLEQCWNLPPNVIWITFNAFWPSLPINGLAHAYVRGWGCQVRIRPSKGPKNLCLGGGWVWVCVCGWGRGGVGRAELSGGVKNEMMEKKKKTLAKNFSSSKSISPSNIIVKSTKIEWLRSFISKIKEKKLAISFSFCWGDKTKKE